MTEILPAIAPNPWAVLGWDGTAFRVFAVDASGHVQLDVLSAALPTGAATSANQATMITALQLIDDLRNALGSVNTDDLQVDVKTSALPSGAATAANQTTMITALQLIDDLRAALNNVGTDELRVLAGLFGATWKALDVDTDGHVQVDVLSGGGGTSDATAAKQDIMITSLQLIDDLRNALHSVGTDRLIVRNEDQAFSFGDKLLDHQSNVDTDAGVNDLLSTVVPAGEVWVVTNVTAQNTVTVCSSIYLHLYDSGEVAALLRKAAPTILEGVAWSGHVYMVPGDRILARFEDCVLHDLIYLETAGYKMSLELGGGPGPVTPTYFDFTEWVEVDEDGDITVAANLITVDSMRRDAVSYLYMDMGADYFGDFIHYLTVRFTDAQTIAGGACWGLSNGAHTYQDKDDANLGLVLEWYFQSSAKLQWILKDQETGQVDYYENSYNATVYLTIQRAGTTLTCKLYSNAARTTLLDTLTVTCATTKYRYVELIQSRDSPSNPSKFFDCWISDFGW